MQTLNKGEWTELYVFLKLLNDSKFDICDSDLAITGESYPILKIFKDNNEGVELQFCLEKDLVVVKEDSDIITKIEKNIFKSKAAELLNCIKKGKGTFTVDSLKDMLIDLNINVKKSCNDKADLKAKVKDLRSNIKPVLTYSIKSQLGSAATILNASNSTNIIYTIKGLNNEDINEINNINSKNKIKDRYDKLIEKKVLFEKIDIQNKTFKENLRYIDGDMPQLVCYIMDYSYRYNTKDIKKIIEFLIDHNPFNVNENLVENFYKNKVAKFIKAMAFGMMPSILWHGKEMVTGGIVITKKNGIVVLLDKVYYEDVLDKYLIENTKLDTPSSSRYHMLELHEYKDQIVFTLNLQIRFKK